MDRPRPVPSPTPLTEPYWTACRRGELALQRCSGCERFVHFPEPVCPFCGGDRLSYETVGGRGAVHTYTVVHRSFLIPASPRPPSTESALPGFEPPFTVAWIDLPERVRVFGDVTGCAPEDVRIGMPVEVCFTELDGFGPVPHWRPA